MQIKINRIALKLSLFSSIIVLAIIAAMTWILLQQGEQSMVAEMKLRSIAYARSAGEAISPQLDTFTLHFNTQEMLKEKGVEYALILDADRKILSHTDHKKIGGIDDGLIARSASETRSALVQQYSRNGISYFDISGPVFSGNRRTGTVHIGFTRASVARGCNCLKMPSKNCARWGPEASTGGARARSICSSSCSRAVPCRTSGIPAPSSALLPMNESTRSVRRMRM